MLFSKFYLSLAPSSVLKFLNFAKHKINFVQPKALKMTKINTLKARTFFLLNWLR